MAWPFKNLDDVLEFFEWARDRAPDDYSWFFDHLPSLFPTPLNPTDYWPSQSNAALEFAQSATDAPAAVQNAAPMPLLGIISPAVVGTPGADVFPLDYAALLAAVAPAPTVAQISGYSAAQGDVVDLSAVLRGSYAPVTAESTQVRVTADASAASATLDLNVGSAQNTHWVALASLDGVLAGETVHVALDASHTVALQATLLA
jgi:hypothetical protein